MGSLVSAKASEVRRDAFKTAAAALATASAHTSHDTEGDSTKLIAKILEKCRAMSLKQLHEELKARGVSTKGLFEKAEFVTLLVKALEAEAHYCRSGRIVPGRVCTLSGPELEEELR